MCRELLVKQLILEGFEEPSERRDIHIFDQASQVVSSIVANNHSISRVEVGTYWNGDYHEKTFLTSRNLAASLVTARNLEIIARLMEEETIEETIVPSLNYGDSTEIIYTHNTFGVSSQVMLLGGQEMHIPMLDLLSYTEGIDDEEIKTISSLILPEGYLLRTTNGYHWYGKQLMNFEEYSSFLIRMYLQNWLRREQGLDCYIDNEFVDLSLERGYGVLRIGEDDQLDVPRHAPFVVSYT